MGGITCFAADMANMMTQVRFALHGPPLEAVASLTRLIVSILYVCIRRAVYGPRRKAWTVNFEIATVFFRAQGRRAFRLAKRRGTIAAARQMIDTLVFRLPHLQKIRIIPEPTAPRSGRWFLSQREGPLCLHLHGGGYVFSPATTDNVIAAITCALGGRTFVPDLRLAPEHSFPSQIDDALLSYQWLTAQAALGSPVVLTGDSSGGHLLLALLLKLSEEGLPLPVASVAISPWTDPDSIEPSLQENAPYDWMTEEMQTQMAAWAGSGGGANHPLFRLMNADLSSLRDVLIHAGESEICRDKASRFAKRARASGAHVTYESWPDMNHNFHGFGDMLPQSRQALDRIVIFVAARIRKGTTSKVVSG
jgi:epsilon-lactone hydrolase